MGPVSQLGSRGEQSKDPRVLLLEAADVVHSVVTQCPPHPSQPPDSL